MRKLKNTRNPILPLDIHIADGRAHRMPDGNLYIYGSYDDREDTYCSGKYYVVSTADMEHWMIHDVAFDAEQATWLHDPDAPRYPGLDWDNPTPFIKKMLDQQKENQQEQCHDADTEETALLYASDAIFKNGTYYLYFGMSDESEGVALSEWPQGPFTHPVQLPCGGIDPAVFEDVDGQAYYYWGQLFAHGVKLNADMVSFEQSSVRHNLVTEEEHYFHEGSSVRKIGDIYYYVYTNIERGKPSSLGYATSKSPLGPFTYQGIIIDNDGCDPASWNNAGSIQEINGRWYVFYHRSSRGTQIHRRLCIEPITINEDGTIDEVKMTSQGIGEPFKKNEKIYGYQACQLSGDVFIGVDGKEGEWLTNISPGDTALFRYVESDKGFYGITIEGEGSGQIDVYFGDSFAGSIEVNKGENGQGNLTDLVKGTKELKLVFQEAEDLKVSSIVLK